MNPSRTGAMVLAILGVLCLAIGGFIYTRVSQNDDIERIDALVKGKDHFNSSLWVSASVVLIGGLMFYFGSKRL